MLWRSGGCHSASPRSLRPRRRKRPSDESAVKDFVMTQLNSGMQFKPRDVRSDDGTRPPRGSRRSARLLVLGLGVTRAWPSASQVRATPMIVTREFSEVAIQAGFTEHDHVIQTLPPNR